MTDASPLARLIRDLITDDGPIGLDRYMALALGHPAYGYYHTRDPLGRSGDFITAPEISQMFGEMIGLWLAETWRLLGEPAHVILVELGPGRGTLMVDALRAARVRPDFRAAIDLHLVETSPVLRAGQAETLAEVGIAARWHDTLATVPAGPVLAIANEFFDALPVRHYQKTERGWHERLVGLDGNQGLRFGLAPEPEPRIALTGPNGSVLEVAADGLREAHRLATRIATSGGAALILDYGHTASGFGETLQAVSRHGFADPLQRPGEVDLTAHVDFAALGRAMRAAGAVVSGPRPQGEFLLALGVEARAHQLATAKPSAGEEIKAAFTRLTAIDSKDGPGMGRLFKVIAASQPGLQALPGFVDEVLAL
ncbi:class I SAM-dependent methyltransferase [Lichenihabitans psoromatis]|uniref:class I SAM-dependent methyltransferase n=1 Tax=Lichenihabitans psoromatis TaxID=2528642 RepID=UPI001036BFDA|nr:SAM-dependent methyltransferase [Lichenihabitans psoromatis]